MTHQEVIERFHRAVINDERGSSIETRDTVIAAKDALSTLLAAPRREPETPPQVEEARQRLVYVLDEYIDELAEAKPVKNAIDLLIAAALSAQRVPETREQGEP